MHEDAQRPWTVAALASAVGMKLSSTNGFIPIDRRKSQIWSALKKE